MRRIVTALGAAALCLFGCAKQATTSPLPQPAPAPQAASDSWVLTDRDASTKTPALLWNGLIGVRIGRNGSGLGSDGKPLGFYMIDEYQPSGEEKILPMPNPILVTWAVGNELFTPSNKGTHDFLKSGGTPLDPSQGHDYFQSLDMRTGVLTTEWKQDAKGGTVTLVGQTVLDPAKRVLAQRWTLTCPSEMPFSIKSLDYGGPDDEQVSIGSDEHGLSLSASKKRVVTLNTSLKGGQAGALSTAAGFRIQEGTCPANQSVTFDRVLSFGPRSPKPLPEFNAANVSTLKSLAPPPATFEDTLSAAITAWSKRWNTDIEIDGPVEDQRAVHSFLYYLRSAIAPKGGMAISPMGLSDDHYNGHVFWDADIWVFPALALIDPDTAQAIPDYRIDKASQAVKNFQDWWKAGSPVANGKLRSGPLPAVPPPGIKFPWESSMSGKETTPTAAQFEDHVTGSVLWGLTMAAELGYTPRNTVDGASSLAANLYVALGQHTSKGFSIGGVLGPDENYVVSNDLYTNLLAEWLTNGRRWNTRPKPAFVLPEDSTSLLTDEGDPVKVYKQASALLSIYPLQYPAAEASAAKMVDRFAPKVMPEGPAMSDSLDALIWARIKDPRAYDKWRSSWQPFTTDPLMLFSENRVSSQTYFTTGAAGCLQTVLYGFLGFRLDSQQSPDAVWSKKLVGASVLSLRPNLPPQWNSVTLRNFSLLGRSYTLTATHSGCRVNPGD